MWIRFGITDNNFDMTSREEKILLLKGIQAGRISVSDVQPKKIIMRIGYDPDKAYMINGNVVDQEAFNLESARQSLLFGEAETVITYGGSNPLLS